MGNHRITHGGWSGVAEAYAQTFAPMCAGTLDEIVRMASPFLGRATNPRVLDVGTGTGALAASLAARGEVSAVDPEADMLRLARDRSGGAQLAQAGLPHLPFGDATFDAVLANFVINHVADPRASVRELARVAAPGACVVATIWPSGRSVLSRFWADIVDAAGAVSPPSIRLPEEMDFPRTAEGMESLLEQAELQDIAVRSLDWDFRVDPDLLWSAVEAGVAAIGKTLLAQPAEVQVAMGREFDRAAVALLHDGELVFPTEALLAGAVKH